MQRTHIHLPITLSNGDLLPYVDATLWHEDGTLLTTPVYDGPNASALQIQWPVTYAPSIVDLWIDEVERVELRLEGPDGFSGSIRAVDFLPSPDEQVQIDKSARVTNAAQPDHWLRVEGGQVSWMGSNQIAPHYHDGVGPNRTYLSLGLDAYENHHTILGTGALSGGDGSTIVGALSSTAVGNGTVVGPDSHTGPGGTILGDAMGGGMPVDAVWLPYGDAGVLDAQVDSDSVVLRSVAVESTTAQIGTAGTVGTGVTNPVWVLGDAKVQELDARGDAVIGGASGVLGFFGEDGTTRATRPAGATGALASLLDALVSYGLLAP